MLSRLELSILAGSLLIWAIMVAGGHVFLPDDVFFYLHIADRILAGQGSTFNGITLTNGYHPLWMGPSLLLRLFLSDRQALAQGLLALCGVLHVVSFLLFARVLKRLSVDPRWPALLLFATYNVTNPVGSEFHISVPLLLLVVDLATSLFLEPPTTRRLLLLGTAAGFAMLARLDNVFFLGAILLATVLGPARSRFIRSSLLIGIPLLIVTVPYLVSNRVYFGAFVPISGSVKMTFAKPGLAKLGGQAVALGLLAATLPFALRRSRVPMLLGGAIATGALVHFAYVALRMDGSWPWYFATEMIAASFALSLWGSQLREVAGSVPAAAKTAVAILLIGGSLSTALVRRTNQLRARSTWYVDAAREIDRVVQPGDAIATLSSPGGIAYFAHRGVFGVDGLTLDFAYHHEAEKLGLPEYFRAHRITHLLGIAPDSPEALRFAQKTKAEGQMEDTAYRLGPDGKTVESMTVLSGLTGHPLGVYEPAKMNAVSRHFCSRDIVIWKLE